MTEMNDAVTARALAFISAAAAAAVTSNFSFMNSAGHLRYALADVGVRRGASKSP